MIKAHTLSLIVISMALTACSASSQKVTQADYESDNKKTAALEIPPDLRDPNQGNLYALPGELTSVYNGGNVLTQIKNARIERSGSQRWLAIDDKKAAEIWPVLRMFWQESGFTIYSEEPKIGVMETDWAENRAKLAHQGLRRLFDKVGLGGVYSTSERDKFLIRMEHNKQGGVDIFFSHKGLEEVYDSKNKDRTVWQPRANDPNLEAVFLSRFMQYLGMDEAAAKQQVNKKQDENQSTAFAKLEQDSVWVAGNPERNVNRIASALDRIGLTVREFVAERGTFIVQPAPKESDVIREANKKTGWFNKWFGKDKETDDKPEQSPQILVALEALENGQRIHLLNQDGKPYQGENKKIWLQNIYRELR